VRQKKFNEQRIAFYQREGRIDAREQILLETIIPQLEEQQHVKDLALADMKARMKAESMSKPGTNKKTKGGTKTKNEITTSAPSPLGQQEAILKAWKHLTARRLELDKKEREVNNLYEVCAVAIQIGEQQRKQTEVKDTKHKRKPKRLPAGWKPEIRGHVWWNAKNSVTEDDGSVLSHKEREKKPLKETKDKGICVLVMLEGERRREEGIRVTFTQKIAEA
jgi:hypothetical protein